MRTTARILKEREYVIHSFHTFVNVRGVSGVIDSVSRICIPMPIQESHIFKRADQKIWPSTHHQIFRVCRGHKVGHNDTILGECDEGILRG